MENFQQNHKKLWQLVEYLLSGGVYFLVGTAFLDFFYYALNWNLWWANIVSSMIGWVANYLMQRYWVFKTEDLKDSQTKVTGRYATITIVDFLINYLILLGLKQVGITPAIGQFFASFFFTGWNYVWYRFWVFPEKGDHFRISINPAKLFLHRPHGHSAFKKG